MKQIITHSLKRDEKSSSHRPMSRMFSSYMADSVYFFDSHSRSLDNDSDHYYCCCCWKAAGAQTMQELEGPLVATRPLRSPSVLYGVGSSQLTGHNCAQKWTVPPDRAPINNWCFLSRLWSIGGLLGALLRLSAKADVGTCPGQHVLRATLKSEKSFLQGFSCSPLVPSVLYFKSCSWIGRNVPNKALNEWIVAK